ncbi:hypothetical protein PIB30_083211 [Stylosanthes scabra]|uniref:Uncharacterized protein n=1 Tax=Stylosanthes scabra TaxID=79078 RepID=A0ABU6ZQW4_9FABA|nr:hypothetical protein [Stylosanthes scabra]
MDHLLAPTKKVLGFQSTAKETVFFLSFSSSSSSSYLLFFLLSLLFWFVSLSMSLPLFTLTNKNKTHREIQRMQPIIFCKRGFSRQTYLELEANKSLIHTQGLDPTHFIHKNEQCNVHIW